MCGREGCEDERDPGGKEVKKHVKASWNRWTLATCKREDSWTHQHIH